MFLANVRTRFSKSSKRYWSPLVSGGFTQMTGEAYERNIDEEKHSVGKNNTQKIERKNLNLRTWIKHLTRKTICFSKLEKMHDIVIWASNQQGRIWD